jgi:hypothetical protein
MGGPEDRGWDEVMMIAIVRISKLTLYKVRLEGANIFIQTFVGRDATIWKIQSEIFERRPFVRKLVASSKSRISLCIFMSLYPYQRKLVIIGIAYTGTWDRSRFLRTRGLYREISDRGLSCTKTGPRSDVSLYIPRQARLIKSLLYGIYTWNKQEMHDFEMHISSVIHIWSKKTKNINVFLLFH